MRGEQRIESQERLRIVFEGLLKKGSIDEICRRNGISTCEFYRWRKKIFRNADRIFRNDA